MTTETLIAQLQAKCARCGLPKSEWTDGRWKHPLCRVGETSYDTHTLVTKDIYNKSDEEIIADFHDSFTIPNDTETMSSETILNDLVTPKSVEQWLRTTLTNVRLSETKKRKELLEKVCELLEMMRNTSYRHEGWSEASQHQEGYNQALSDAKTALKDLLDDNK